MSNPKLTAKMREALEYVNKYGIAGPFKTSTLAALESRGLIDSSHGVRDGFAWEYRVTRDGVTALTPADESTESLPKHLAPLTGKRVMAVLVQDNKLVKRFTGRVLSEYLSAPVHGFRIPVVEVSDPFSAKRYSVLRSYVVALAETTTESALLAAEQALIDTLAAQGVDVPLTPSAVPVAAETDRDAILALVEYGTHLSDHIGNGASIDLGVVVFHADCTRSAITPDGDIIVRHADGDSWKTAHRALVLEHKRNAHRLALSENEARKPVAYDIEDELLGEDRVSIEILVRTLISYGITTGAQFTAYAEKILAHDDSGTKVARSIRIDELITGPADMWQKPHTVQDSINEIRRVGDNYPDGVNFVDKSEPSQAFTDTMNADVYLRPSTQPGVLEQQIGRGLRPTVSATEAFNVIDFNKYPVSLTTEQVIADPTGAVREWLLGSPHATPSVEHDGSNL